MVTVAELKQVPRDQRFPFEAVLLLKKVGVRKAKNDSEFLMAELGDRTGLFHVVCFENSALHQVFSALEEGTVVRVEGHTGYYQDRFSPHLTLVEPVPEEELGALIDTLVETAPLPIDQLHRELQEHVAALSHQKLREVVEFALAEVGPAFTLTPGAISMHHAYRGGLLEHTVRMARAVRALAPLYPEVHADLALAGVILHDIGKCQEYEARLATRRTRAGILQGHVVLGFRVTRRACLTKGLDEETTERLEHIILSHQGEPEWGAAVRAASPEAVFVSLVDNLDAKLGMVQHALRVTPAGEDFSEHVPGLMAPILVRPVPGHERRNGTVPTAS